ncbi:hypothetical protein [Thalassobacillus pellis]|uniref:hypothetical protein n=1 Tax=Thalassobacillus pellis TaxID=748008 RepID=UPI001960C65B|nr:hypothetical protein [Thalassobacillus pellis]MBM7554901.1 hypothetical protein [Thalassobacillus pellis]
MRNKACNLGSIPNNCRKAYSQEIRNMSEKLKEEAADLAVNNCASYVDGECVIKGGLCKYETELPIGATWKHQYSLKTKI